VFSQPHLSKGQDPSTRLFVGKGVEDEKGGKVAHLMNQSLESCLLRLKGEIDDSHVLLDEVNHLITQGIGEAEPLHHLKRSLGREGFMSIEMDVSFVVPGSGVLLPKIMEQGRIGQCKLIFLS